MSAAAGGWFPVARADVQAIQDHAGDGGAGTMLAAWLALISIANTENSNTVAVHIGRVARLSGYSYRSTADALRRLATAGLLTITPRKMGDTQANDASLYALRASVAPCAKFAQPSVDTAQPSVNDNGGTLPTDINNKKQKNKRGCASAPTPATFFELAFKTNSGRLPATELERFSDYWLERDTKGRCRFQAQKFFDMSRRISTWAARDGRRNAPATGLLRRAD